MNNILAVFIGGGLGSLSRYGLGLFVQSFFKSVFPIATLCSNVISCAVLAIIVGVYGSKGELSTGIKMLIIVGFCGGFSTFSTFSFETIELFRSGNVAIAVANIVVSVVSCFGIVYLISR